jgi:hypothetical protein
MKAHDAPLIEEDEKLERLNERTESWWEQISRTLHSEARGF